MADRVRATNRLARCGKGPQCTRAVRALQRSLFDPHPTIRRAVLNALVALEDWRFAPAYRSGRRVTVIANIDIAFKLRNDRGRQLLNEAKQRISDVQQRLELEALIRCVRGEQDVTLALLVRCRPG